MHDLPIVETTEIQDEHQGPTLGGNKMTESNVLRSNILTKRISEPSETCGSTVSPLHPNCNQCLVNPGEVRRIWFNFEREMIILKATDT